MTDELQGSTLHHRVDDLFSRIQVHPVTSAAGLEAVYRLRYSCYLEEGAIDARLDERLYDEFDLSGRGQVFGFFEHDQLIGSIRLQVLTSSSRLSASAMAFPDVVQPLLDAGKTLLDPTRFVIDTTASRRFPAIAYFALRTAFIAAHHYGVDLALASVRREHMPFYTRTLHYKTVREPRPYLMLTKPLGLMIADYPAERQHVLVRHPFFQTRAGEAQRLFGTGGA